ncbi:MAG: 3-hydroxyacyl-CoA dehydrogenase/enoyl-CoA hydratase family protein [Oscillospiraceae bacterium]|nr:3-hydroxyacyl-CoA dehydrogenase/enoyl-CoA hydratase family protein [Oscillospiraceae bacterium]
MSKNINKAVVMGAGVMGASIAGLLASVGVQVTMLDIVPPKGLTDEEKTKGLTEQSYEFRNRFALAGLANVKKPRNNMLYYKGAIQNIRIGNTSDNLDYIRDADWIVEAASENVAVKQSVFRQIEPYRQADAIVSSNTSGVSVHKIVDGLSDDLKKYFMGTHFFNPPRWMALFEMIATKWTDKDAYARMQEFAENSLGKIVVNAKDTPNFVGNRIGVFAGISAMKLCEKYGYDIPTLDRLTGPIMAHPKSATFKTSDMVGIDILCHVADNVLAATTDEKEKLAYDPPQWVKDMVTAGLLGDKVKKGFYKKEVIDGKRVTLCYDPAAKTYINKKADELPILDEAKSSPNKYEFMTYGDSKEQKFTYEMHKILMLYTARLVPEIADDFKEIDRALTAGFNWGLGVFQMWDKIGVRRSVEAWQADGEEIPKWVLDMLASGQEKFYATADTTSKYLTLKGAAEVAGNENASVRDIGDDVLCLEFHSTGNAIGELTGEMIFKAMELLESGDWQGLVIGNEGKNFCAGADLVTIVNLAQDKEFDKLNELIISLQNGTKALKFAPRPVVAAPFGQTLGGGCEVAIHCPAAVPHTDTFMGLVEVGVGLIPAGGGCTEMLIRLMDRCFNDQKKSRYDAVKALWQYIMMAKVNVGADAAIEAGYFSKGTYVERNKAKQLQSAKEMVLWMAAHNYRPGADPTIKVAGDYGYGAIAYDMLMMKNGHFGSDHDIKIGEKIARIVTGGKLPYGAEVPAQQIRDLEREAFLSLAGEQKTQDRIIGMLMNGKPVRN